MDNNNTSQVPQNPIPPQQPSGPQPVVPTTPSTSPPQAEEGNRMALWLIGGLIVVILIVGLIYWYLSRGASRQTDQPVKTPPPVSQGEPDLEKDLNTIEVGDVETELSDVDKDLESL